MKDLPKASEQYFGTRCLGNLDKLVFQARSTPQHHFLLFKKDGVIDDVDQVDDVFSAELPAAEQKRELWDLVKSFNMPSSLTFLPRKDSSRQWIFGLVTNEVNPITYIDETYKLVVNRRRKE